MTLKRQKTKAVKTVKISNVDTKHSLVYLFLSAGVWWTLDELHCRGHKSLWGSLWLVSYPINLWRSQYNLTTLFPLDVNECMSTIHTLYSIIADGQQTRIKVYFVLCNLIVFFLNFVVKFTSIVYIWIVITNTLEQNAFISSKKYLVHFYSVSGALKCS